MAPSRKLKSTMTSQELEYERASDTYNINFAEGLKLFNELAKQGYAPAYYRVGKGLYYAHGTCHDLPLALKYLRKAATAGVARAHYILSLIHGRDLKDPVAAFKHMLKAAEGDDETAMYEVASFYKTGYGCTPSRESALKWFEKAAACSVQDAKRNVTMLRLEIAGQPIPRHLRNKAATPQ